MLNNATIVIGASVVSTTAGGLAGFFYAKKKLKAYYEELADQEIQAAREFYNALDKTGDFETPEKAVKKLIGEDAVSRPIAPTKETVAATAGRALAQYQGQKVQVVDPGTGLTEALGKVEEESEPMAPVEAGAIDEVTVTVVEETTTSVFVDGEPYDPDKFDLEAEIDSRRNGVPYVISRNEYDENPDDNDQSVLTWFVHDNTLVDENEREIDAVEKYVGRANLQRFGDGSGDALIVFVRNEKEGMDYEILKSEASYVETSLGLTDDSAHELKHSSSSRRRRRRFDDE